MQKINFQDLPSTTTPLNAANLNTLQDNIETTLNTYSTNEIVIGTHLGKPLYRKTYTGTAVKNTNKVIDTISNLDKIINGYGSSTSQYDWKWGIPNNTDDGYKNNYRFSTVNNNLQLVFGDYYSTSDVFVFTIEYTKTID